MAAGGEAGSRAEEARSLAQPGPGGGVRGQEVAEAPALALLPPGWVVEGTQGPAQSHLHPVMEHLQHSLVPSTAAPHQAGQEDEAEEAEGHHLNCSDKTDWNLHN